MSEQSTETTEPEDHLGMTDEQWAWFQAHTHGYGEQDKKGIDVSLLRETLGLTPMQRVEKMLRVLPMHPAGGAELTAEGLHHLLTALDLHRVRYVLTGGFAMTCHGSAYLTDDIDLVCACEPANRAALARALVPLRARHRRQSLALQSGVDLEALRADTSLAFVTDAGNVQLLAEAPGASSFDVLRERSSQVDLIGVPVQVAALADLIANKRAGDRPKDKLHLMELERLRSLLEENEWAKLEGEQGCLSESPLG